MSLLKLTVDDLRCIEHAELELHPGQNLIWGGNGSGKTSLLEAIFLLGRGRSFRTRNSERLIRYGRERLIVFGRSALVVEREEAARVISPGMAPQVRAAHAAGAPALPGARPPLGSSVDQTGSATTNAPRMAGMDSVVGASLTESLKEESLWRKGSGADPGADSGTDSGADSGADVRPAHTPRAGAPGTSVLNSQRLGAPPHSDRLERGDKQPGEGARAEAVPPLPDALVANTPIQALGLQVSRTDGTVARINGTTAKSLTELTQVFPVQIIDPGIHKLLEEGGHRRRRWLDWGVFHVEQQFGDWWVRYARVVKQRNAALRSQPEQAAAWDPELVRLGELIAAVRGQFVERLLPYWRESVIALSGLEPELHYFRGWGQDLSLAEALQNSWARDQAKGITHPGPHRCDVMVRLNGRPAREVLSRGQQKLVAVAMTLSQLNLLKEATQTSPTLLLDDPAAELDGDHLRRFIEQVMRLRSQLVLTSLHPEFQLFGTPDRVFHVEQGRVLPV